MTIMDCNEKLRLAKEALDSGSYDKETIEYIFPELAESDDEKIRKAIIEHFKGFYGFPKLGEFPMEKIYAWLEKQGEQEDPQKLFNIAKHQGYKEGLRDGRAEVWAQIEKQGKQKHTEPQQDMLPQEQYAKAVGEAIYGDVDNLHNYLYGEQKPVAWSKEDEKELDRVIYMMKQLNLTKSWDDCYNFLNVLKNRVLPQSLLQQEWSEEDENEVAILEAYIRSNDWSESHVNRALGIVDELVKKLKSLKERSVPQPKKDWSEEDERLCQCLIKDQEKALDEVRNDKYGHSEIISDLKEMYNERIDWLKSLKPQSHWKPSKEELEALNVAKDRNDKIGFVLGELYEQLKALLL